jgi:hypothetical protein
MSFAPVVATRADWSKYDISLNDPVQVRRELWYAAGLDQQLHNTDLFAMRMDGELVRHNLGNVPGREVLWKAEGAWKHIKAGEKLPLYDGSNALVFDPKHLVDGDVAPLECDEKFWSNVAQGWDACDNWMLRKTAMVLNARNDSYKDDGMLQLSLEAIERLQTPDGWTTYEELAGAAAAAEGERKTKRAVLEKALQKLDGQAETTNTELADAFRTGKCADPHQPEVGARARKSPSRKVEEASSNNGAPVKKQKM